MSIAANVLIFLFMVPFFIGWAILLAVPMGAFAVAVAAAPSAFRQLRKPVRKRVLIVEDDLGMKLLLEEIVKSASPEAIILSSESEEEATKILQERALLHNDFDFVIADIFLAGNGTGVDLWRKSRSYNMPFVFASITQRAVFEKMLNSDAATIPLDTEMPIFLQKPLDPLESVSAIRKAIASS